MQIYEENEEFLSDDGIDILDILDTMWKNFRKYRMRFLALMLLITAVFAGYTIYSYHPSYESYVTFVVEKNQGSNADTVVAQRIAKTFQYVLKNGGLESRIRKELGIVKTAPMPATLNAASMEDTNFLTVTALSGVDAQALQTVQAVIKYLPEYVSEVVGNTNLTVIDQSGLPDGPVNPMNKIKTVLKGLLLGLLAALVILFLLAYNDSTIRRYEDLKKHLNVACLAVVPLTKFKKRNQKFDSRISINNDKVPSSFREAVNTLRTRVEKEMRENNLKTLLISSSIPGEGKTTMALNLALAFKDRDKKVLLIDGDLRNPNIHSIVGVKEKDIKIGITDVLQGKAEPSEAIINHSLLNLNMILGRKAVNNASELLSSQRMQAMIDELYDYYDYIIFDTPPAAMMTDASVVAAYMDAALYIIRQDYSKVNYITEGIGLLADSDAKIIGCVLNCAEAGIVNYGYNKYGYGKYGSVYGND